MNLSVTSVDCLFSSREKSAENQNHKILTASHLCYAYSVEALLEKQETSLSAAFV
jgi:hypothetical protein